jgi:hypothetical protein
MLDACAEDAAKAGMKGVAVLARQGPWLADARLFLANGFETFDTAPPDYELLVRKLKPSAANPEFRKSGDHVLARYRRGLTIVSSSQCPYAVKFAAEITETARTEYGIEPRLVTLKSWRDAQNAPTPYAVFSIISDGKVVADHQISRTRFRNIMKQCGVEARRGASDAR